MRRGAHRARRASAGFTLIEIMISIVVLGLLLSSVGLVSLSNRRAFEQGAGSADLEVQVRRVADLVVRELMRTGQSMLIPDPAGAGTSDLQYEKAIGIENGGTKWSDPFELYWDYEVGEIDDGVDNNGNGLVDEGRVIFVRNKDTVDEDTTVICHNVSEYLEGEIANNADDNGNGLEDERGFCLERVDDAIVLRVTVESIVAESGLQKRTLETSVRLRN